MVEKRLNMLKKSSKSVKLIRVPINEVEQFIAWEMINEGYGKSWSVNKHNKEGWMP